VKFVHKCHTLLSYFSQFTVKLFGISVCYSHPRFSWLEACIGEEVSATTELEEGLRNGVVLAKLAHFITPDKVPLRKVYDKDLSRYRVSWPSFLCSCILLLYAWIELYICTPIYT